MMFVSYFFSVLLCICLFLLSIKYKNNLFKIYSQYNAIQKLHEGYVPPIGGLIIFLCFYFSIFTFSESFFNNQIHILFGSFFIIIIGLLEDFSGKIKQRYLYLSGKARQRHLTYLKRVALKAPFQKGSQILPGL